MELNVKKAFCSPFSDEKWYIKLIFPSVVTFLGLLSNNLTPQYPFLAFILLVILLIPALVLSGFFAQFANNEIHDNSPLLPNIESKVKDFLEYGIKFLEVMIVYLLVFLTIAVVIGIALGAILGIIASILNFKAIVPIVAALFFIPLGVLALAFLALVEGIFFDNFSFKESLDYKRALNLLSKVKLEIGFYILLFACLSMATSIINALLSPFTPSLLIICVLMAVVQMIFINIKAQIYKIAKERLG